MLSFRLKFPYTQSLIPDFSRYFVLCRHFAYIHNVYINKLCTLFGVFFNSISKPITYNLKNTLEHKLMLNKSLKPTQKKSIIELTNIYPNTHDSKIYLMLLLLLFNTDYIVSWHDCFEFGLNYLYNGYGSHPTYQDSTSTIYYQFYILYRSIIESQ